MGSTPELLDEPVAVCAGEAGIDLATPDGRIVTLTREAAIASARRLLHVAGAEAEEDTYQKSLG